MNLSRSDKQRTLPSLSLVRWSIIIAGFILFVIVTFVLYIRSADSGHRLGEKKAYQIALNQGGLADVSKATIHTWNETVWVVDGEDAEGASWMLWVRDSGLVKEKVSDNISKEQMLEKFIQENDGREPLRIIPGWFENMPVWEVRYQRVSDDEHQMINFYSFKDGTKLETYILSN